VRRAFGILLCIAGCSCHDPLEVACAKGDAGACASLGKQRITDSREAEALLKKACDWRDAEGCVALGDLYAEPRSRLDGSLKLTRERACELGSGLGCRKLGALLRDGDYPHRVNVDPSGSTEAFRRGCDLQDGVSCTAWGDRLASGRGVASADPSGAVEAYRKGCQLKDAAACSKMTR
jgi:TPR repeat protein